MVHERPSASDSESSVDVVVFAGRRKNRHCHLPEDSFEWRNFRLEGKQKTGHRSAKQVAYVSARDECAITISNQSSISGSNSSMPGIAEPSGQAVTPESMEVNGLVTRLSNKARVKANDVVDDYLSNMQDYKCLGDHFSDSRFSRRDLGGFGALADDDYEYTNDRHCVNRGEPKGFMPSGPHKLTTPDQSSSSIPCMRVGRQKGGTANTLSCTTLGTAFDPRWRSPDEQTTIEAPHKVSTFDQCGISNSDSDEIDDSDSDAALAQVVAMDLEEESRLIKLEKELHRRYMASMPDEQIARTLNKQAQLGISGDEIVIFDANGLVGDIYERPLEDIDTADSSRLSRSMRSGKSSKGHTRLESSARISTESFGSDAYNAFDTVGYGRPSLPRRPRSGNRSDPLFELPDLSVQEDIHATWAKDRVKKKQRKREREELRAQGLLGKKSKKNVSSGLRTSINIQHLKDDIKAFLLSSIQQLKLPPMAQQERKLIHEAANTLNLKSKSQGNGLSRCPILYKTSRTRKFYKGMLDFVDDMSYRQKCLPRHQKHKNRSGLPRERSRSSGTSLGVSYQDGEIVGIGAPELGQENRGRAMLERMGWSDGSALGASNNKGITVPVTQVVKVSKAGLG